MTAAVDLDRERRLAALDRQARGLLESVPGLAARLTVYLSEVENMTDETQEDPRDFRQTVRVGPGLLERLEALRARMLERPDMTPRGRLSRAELLRLAIVRGVKALEDDLRKGEGEP